MAGSVILFNLCFFGSIRSRQRWGLGVTPPPPLPPAGFHTRQPIICLFISIHASLLWLLFVFTVPSAQAAHLGAGLIRL